MYPLEEGQALCAKPFQKISVDKHLTVAVKSFRQTTSHKQTEMESFTPRKPFQYSKSRLIYFLAAIVRLSQQSLLIPVLICNYHDCLVLVLRYPNFILLYD